MSYNSPENHKKEWHKVRHEKVNCVNRVCLLSILVGGDFAKEKSNQKCHSTQYDEKKKKF